MSDPKPTIRVEGVCRGDGRCPECGNFAPPAELRRRLSCLCETHADCTVAHANALLTEALRQLSEAQVKLHPARRVDPGFVIAPEDESNG